LIVRSAHFNNLATCLLVWPNDKLKDFPLARR
jgi:hypothetical protein